MESTWNIVQFGCYKKAQNRVTKTQLSSDYTEFYSDMGITIFILITDMILVTRLHCLNSSVYLHCCCYWKIISLHSYCNCFECSSKSVSILVQ